ncbi:hypothetical protein KVR01_009141 [Diaporthe batatas]|uniref:uncharacterized protein n=1 Tax=Diaporthe batatas TaxID=748121 RepID=UPI001D05276D|nr:uncharacterized protein KVR01_009141 [Diaporthe batatas]KAG8160877.1 hypothetical protein KVR01_009141 [Diaporthe batatas]
MVPSSTALITAAAAASLLLGPALATGSSYPDPAISRPQNLNSDGPVAAHAAAEADQASHEMDDDESAEVGVPEEDWPLDWQPELKRSEAGGEEEGRVLLKRETSAAPTIYGVSIWLILAWLALLYLMYKTGSL